MTSGPGPRRVLFLPGAGGDGRFWRPLADHLRLGCEQVFFDWPGLGHVPPDPHVTGLDDLVAMVVDRMDRPVDLLAQSMGGVVAIRAALARPASVRRLVLTATSGGIDLSPFAAADWRADYRREFPDAARWITDHRAQSDLSGLIPAIGAPALLLWGDADEISPVSVGRYLAGLLPRAHLVVVPGADHAFARDRAAEIAPHVRAHLD